MGVGVASALAQPYRGEGKSLLWGGTHNLQGETPFQPLPLPPDQDSNFVFHLCVYVAQGLITAA